ncbi:MAG: glycosyltransferase [Thermoleophilia bacterium]|nr:glycosyltransferase [Thermoleophilia bacterium]
MRILYYCPFAQQNGYSRAAANYLMALVEYELEEPGSVEVRIVPLFPFRSENIEEGYGVLDEYVATDPVRELGAMWPTHVIVHAMPGVAVRNYDQLRKQYPEAEIICITTWETSAMHLGLSTTLGLYDRIIVPSRHVANVLDNRGLLDIVEVEHCFDPDFWVPELIEEPTPEYVFYTIGADSQRKNLEGLLKAYLTGFTESDPVVLRIHAGPGILAKVNAIKARAGFHDAFSFPTVEITDGERLDMESLLELHRAGDCFVSLSRGEGWGLGAFEAALVGNDVIANDFGGPRHFLPELLPSLSPPYDNNPGYGLVRGSFTPVFSAPEAITRTIGIGSVTLPMPGVRTTLPEGANALQCWFEPDLVDARALMRALFQARISKCDPRARYESAMKTHAIATELYGYDAIGKKLIQALETT